GGLGAAEGRGGRAPAAADVHRPGGHGQVEPAVAGDRVPVVRRAKRADDVDEFLAAFLAVDDPLLVLLGFQRDAALLRDHSTVEPRGVEGEPCYVGGHSLPLVCSPSGSAVGRWIRMGPSPMGRNSWSLMSSERSLMAALSRQNTPISEPS